MTHKGGKKAKKAFHRLKMSSAMKERIENLPHKQLQALMIFIKALMAASSRTGRAGRHKKAAKSSRSPGRKLRAGLHRVKVGKHMRNVRVLSNGKWRFMKG